MKLVSQAKFHCSIGGSNGQQKFITLDGNASII